MTAISAGTQLPTRTFPVTRADLVRYAGASGDFNPIHWSDRQAVNLGLPGVIAHGMLTMALAGRAITEWLGDPGALREYGVKFSAMLEIPDDDTGATVTVDGEVTGITDDGDAKITLTVTANETAVITRARAVARIPAENNAG